MGIISQPDDSRCFSVWIIRSLPNNNCTSLTKDQMSRLPLVFSSYTMSMTLKCVSFKTSMSKASKSDLPNEGSF